jgi:hypothetical protein
MNSGPIDHDNGANLSAPRSYGFKGARWGALIGAILSVALFWLTQSYVSFVMLPIVTAYGYWLRPGIRNPGPFKSRW